MTTSSIPRRGPASNPAHESLLALFRARGGTHVDTPVLHAADIFLDLSGEDIRRRLFLTSDVDGRELCLRPEYTIPVCLRHLADGGGRADYSYLGPVFRQRPGESGEFLQAGFESIGRADPCPADAEILRLAVDGLALFGPRDLEIRIGDMGLLEAFLRALAVPASARRRFVRDVAAGYPPGRHPRRPRDASTDHAGLLAAIAGQDPGAARAFVEDVLSIAGITRVGGRSAGEIADRFLSRATEKPGGVSGEAGAVLTRYLAILGDPDDAAARIRALAADASLDLGGALDAVEERTGFMAALGLPVESLVFAADFARNLDYYTGFIFEVRERGRPDARVIAAGGRYDGLLDHLGRRAGGTPSVAMPAVGFSFWLDRLAPTGEPA